MGLLGWYTIAAAAAVSLVGASLLVVGLVGRRPELAYYGRNCVWPVLALSAISVIVMEVALNTHRYDIRYVFENVADATPRLFTITALWGALEGSILLWGLILAVFMAAAALQFRRRADDPLVGWATAVQLLVALFFFALMAIVANPFEATGGVVTPLDGTGPNPLLQNHPLMAFHPPMLYAGYVGFTIPFSFAIAALVTGRFGEGWLADTRRASLIAWGFLTVGIVLGAWWSYEVLGWGGYWAWDPVENASLMPWLTATAFLHSVMVQERRGMLRVWNLSLVVATFLLTIVGTMLTRSGLVESVHAFSESDIGHWLAGFLLVVLIGSVGLIAWRGDAISTPGRIDSMVSREAAFLFNNLLFAGFALVVLIGTVFPSLAEIWRDGQFKIGEPYFRDMTTPIGIALLFLMAVAPVLPWRATSTTVLRDRLLVPAIIGVTTMALVVLMGGDGIAQVLSFGLGAFCAAGIVRNFAVAIRARRRSDSVRIPSAAVRVVRGNPRQWGGLVVHLGVVIIAVAIAASSGYATKRSLQLAEGESAKVAGYTITYLGSVASTSVQKQTVVARLRIERGARDLGVYEPAISSFPNSRGAIGTPSVRTGLREDVYLSLSSSENDEGRIGLTVGVNPLVLWLWVGGAVMAFGVVVCLVPQRRSRPRDGVSNEPSAAARTAVTV